MGNLIWIIVVVLIVLWLLGAFVMPVGGGLIHILIVIALIIVVWRLATGKKVL
ncbi:MAG: lmo0937 family membrane protein [Acidobacteria bacterium]|nr:lmo0937 family membrane protein [Acidobacteriota bacterium]